MNDYDQSFIDFDLAVLTAILTPVLPAPQKAAYDLLEHFSSFQHAARADEKSLSKIIGRTGAKLLRTIPNAVISMTRETAMNAASYILTLEAARAHLSAILNGRRNEVFVVLYLNMKNRLIDEDVWHGSIGTAHIYPREIMRRALILDAVGVIIAHNHPSGDPLPSIEHIQETLQLEQVLDTIDVILFDHVIFGEGEPYSLRENGDI